jgi:hypothetical protein
MIIVLSLSSMVMSHPSKGTAWQNGIRDDVFLAASVPATIAVRRR